MVKNAVIQWNLSLVGISEISIKDTSFHVIPMMSVLERDSTVRILCLIELVVCIYIHNMLLVSPYNVSERHLSPLVMKHLNFSLQLLITWRPAKNSVISCAERRGWGRERRAGRSVRSWSSCVRVGPALWSTSRREGRSSLSSWRKWEGHQRSVTCSSICGTSCFQGIKGFGAGVYNL